MVLILLRNNGNSLDANPKKYQFCYTEENIEKNKVCINYIKNSKK